MNKPNILVAGDYPDWDSAPMEETYTTWNMPEGSTPDHLPPEAFEAVRAIAFRGHSRLSGEIMDRFPNLGMIANFGVGYDTIDVAHALTRGIRVTNTPDILTEDVADLAIGMMIAWSRDMVGAQTWITSGKWGETGEYRLQRKVSGKRAGIVGLGRIGRAVAERLVPFNMDISYFSRDEKETPGWKYHSNIIELAAEVDVLFVCVSGGASTQNLIGKEALNALGPKGLLINISRGTTIDEDALLDALEGGHIAGAGLDVFLHEPKINPRFLKLSNVVLQPHQSSGTYETRMAMGELQRANLAAFFAGSPLVTPVPECA